MSASEPRIAVVLAGAGARGAYEAGVMSEVLPHLEADGVRPDLYVGTSAGAVNATLLAAGAHLPVEEQVTDAIRFWRGLRPSDVFRPIVPTAPRALARGLGQLMHAPGARLMSLVDTGPLDETAQRAVSWTQLRDNVAGGLAELAVVATSTREGRTAVFVDRASEEKLPPPDETRGIDYVTGEIGAEHVLASAAIPVLFPARRLDDPTGCPPGWFVDGGVRLNAPLKPAIALGADQLVIVATHPVAGSSVTRPGPLGPPDVDDALVALLDAALVDRMVEDVRTLAKVNETAPAVPAEPDGRRQLPFLFVGPAQRSTIAELATAWMRGRWSGLVGIGRRLLEPDLSLLAWMFGGDGPRRGDLLSYLLFDSDFAGAVIELGRADARAVLGEPGAPVPWRTAVPNPV